MKCKSIEPRYDSICENIDNPRFCQYCEGSSGIGREKEVKYLEMLYQKANTTEPGLLEKGLNLGKAMVNYALDGFANVSEEDYKKRLNICENCPERTENWVCKKCGCGLKLKAKWASQSCPLGKWNNEKELK